MKNFIRRNIDNVKGTKLSMSIERENNKKPNSKYHSVAKRSQVSDRLADLQQKISQIEQSHHNQIIEQLSAIKDDIRLIKSHIFDEKYLRTEKQSTQGNAWEEDAIVINQTRLKSHASEQQDSKLDKNTINKNIQLEELLQIRLKKSQSNYVKNKLNFKALASMIKDYKLEGPQYGNIFFGYSKKNSHPVAVKYSPQGLGNVLEIYDRLWKNIAKAKWPCINRILDYGSEDSTYIIMQKNKGNIVGLPAKAILIDTLKIIEFIHECGYLYRNVEPEHLMLNEEGQLVIIDFKRAKRYVDIKGRALDVVDNYYSGSPFASNNQLRGLPESRKDDLQSLGYLALLLLELQIPWMGCNKQQTIRIRSSLTLQQLFKGHTRWVQYMAVVMKTVKGERPDYKRLLQILQLS